MGNPSMKCCGRFRCYNRDFEIERQISTGKNAATVAFLSRSRQANSLSKIIWKLQAQRRILEDAPSLKPGYLGELG